MQQVDGITDIRIRTAPEFSHIRKLRVDLNQHFRITP